MKTFKRCKTYEEIKAQCGEQGLYFNDKLYLEKGSDHVVISSDYYAAWEGANDRDRVMYNTTNGRFFGKTDTGICFNSDVTTYDGEDWMQALLSFFMVEKDPTPVTLAQQIFEADERARSQDHG